MATRGSSSKGMSCPATSLLLLLSLLCLASLFIISPFSTSPIPSVLSPPIYSTTSQLLDSGAPSERSPSCNYSDGEWIRSDGSVPPRYDNTCKEIFKGWNCINGGKSNARELTQWRWQPRGCNLPSFDPMRFLQRYRNKNIGFVGDSLNRNMFVSLVCTLKRVSGEVKKWRPCGADRGFTFIEYNLTVAYHRTNLLVQYGWWSASSSGGALESLGYKQGYRVDVDIPAHTWVEAPLYHNILILNTGHW